VKLGIFFFSCSGFLELSTNFDQSFSLQVRVTFNLYTTPQNFHRKTTTITKSSEAAPLGAHWRRRYPSLFGYWCLKEAAFLTASFILCPKKASSPLSWGSTLRIPRRKPSPSKMASPTPEDGFYSRADQEFYRRSGGEVGPPSGEPVLRVGREGDRQRIDSHVDYKIQ
jgi:hypothetical protein